MPLCQINQSFVLVGPIIMILNENEHQQPIFKRNRIQLKCTKGSPNRVIRTYSSLSKITVSRMWGDNTKGLSSTGLLRPTDISFGFAGTKNIIIMIIIMIIINFSYISFTQK